MLIFVAIICKLHTECCNSSSDTARKAWASAKREGSNYEFPLIVVIPLYDVSHHFLIMSLIHIKNNGGKIL